MNKLAIKARQTRIMEMVLEGKTQAEIHDIIGDSVDTIRRDMVAIRAQLEQNLKERWDRALGQLPQAPLLTYMPSACIHSVALAAHCGECQRLSELFYKIPTIRVCMGVWTPFLIDQALHLENLELTPE